MAAAILMSTAPRAYAVPVLTPAGVNDGFILSTFVSGYNFGATYGPIAQGILSNGNVITGSMGNNRIYVFNDVDNQTLGSAITSAPYSCQTGNCNFAMASAGGEVYGAQLFGGIYEHFASNGTFTPIANLQAAGLFGYLGMWTDPLNGHIISASNKGLVEIDPVAGTFRVINASLFPDGVSLSPDGSTVYVENGGTVQSYSFATGQLIHTYFTGHSPDGTGVIIGGAFNGDVIVNNNDGTIGLLDPTKPDGNSSQFVIIATGGTRGDFVSPDITNGTLFLSEYDNVTRLSCGPGCSIGVASPEPASAGLVAAAFGGLLWVRRRVRCGSWR